MKREAPAIPRYGALGAPRVCVTGVGGAKAASTLDSFLEATPGVDGVLVVGFAAGLRKGLHTGDLVVARCLLTVGDGEAIQCDLGLLHAAKAVLERSGARYETGDTLTVGEALISAEEKLSHGRQTGALAASMEDHRLAGVCARRGVPFLSVRSVLDEASQELPDFVAGLGDKGPLVQMAHVALNLAVRPRCLPAVANLRKQVRRAQDSLDSFAISFLKELDSRSEASAAVPGTLSSAWSKAPGA